jgi:RNA polymerase sigma factor for flagellar operon FliA
MTVAPLPRIEGMAKRKAPVAAADPEADRERLAGLPVEELWTLYSRTQSEGVRHELILRHQPLVSIIAEREAQRLPRSVDVDDLKQEGFSGLNDAIQRFDPSRGFKFKTFASRRIRGAMLDSLRKLDWQPRNERQRSNQVETARAELREKLGRDPTDQEIARRLRLKDRDVQRLQPRQMHSVSDRRQSAHEDSDHTLDSLAESREENPIDHAHRKDLMEELGRVLSEKERTILAMYYMDGLTFRQIGQHLSITESRVCQIHTNVKRRLKQQFEDRQEQFGA